MTNPSLLILPGDGIGTEIMAETRKVIDWFSENRGITFDIHEDLVGGAAYDAYGSPCADSTMEKAQAVDAVLLGAVGGPKYEGLEFALQPERGLLRLRKEMDLFANLRPAVCFDALKDFSSLKPDLVAGLDIMIVRELTSGVYFGEPRGISEEGIERVGVNTHHYTESEIARVARSAFELARRRSNRVCSMEKRNVMEAGILWHDVVEEVHKAEYSDVELSHMLADAGGMQLVRAPKQFDVILTDNLFGDMLSDCAAMLTGSLGMLPSASLGAPMANGRPKAMYEPVHGSAPDIAGQGKGQPDRLYPELRHGAPLLFRRRGCGGPSGARRRRRACPGDPYRRSAAIRRTSPGLDHGNECRYPGRAQRQELGALRPAQDMREWQDRHRWLRAAKPPRPKGLVLWQLKVPPEAKAFSPKTATASPFCLSTRPGPSMRSPKAMLAALSANLDEIAGDRSVKAVTQ